MQLQPTETILLTTDEDAFTLTNLRVHGNIRDWGYSNKIFIFLEDISSIQVLFRSYVLLLVFAGLSALYGLWAAFTDKNTLQLPGDVVPGFGVALLLLLIWWATRRRVIAIYPNGGKPLEIAANKMEAHRADELLERIQQAKTERVRVLYKL